MIFRWLRRKLMFWALLAAAAAVFFAQDRAGTYACATAIGGAS